MSNVSEKEISLRKDKKQLTLDVASVLIDEAFDELEHFNNIISIEDVLLTQIKKYDYTYNNKQLAEIIICLDPCLM